MVDLAAKIDELEKENKELREQLDACLINVDDATQKQLSTSVLNTIDDFIFYKDLSFTYVGCNDAFSDFVGLAKEQIIGKNDYELFDKEFADIFRNADKEMLESLKTRSNYETVKHSNGTILELFTQKAPLKNMSGELIGLVGISSDVTESQATAHKLERANEFLVDAQTLANIGHWEWDIIVGDITWSDQIFRIFGHEAQSFQPTYDLFLSVIHGDDRESVSNAVIYALENKTVYDIQHRIILPDSSQKIVHEIGHAIYDEDGKALRMIGTVQDITELYLIEQDLKEQKEAFEAIFENSFDGASIISNGKFTKCNDALVKMLGASSKDDIINTHPTDISPEYQEFGELSSEKAEKMINICLEKGHHQFEWLHKRFNGEVFWAEIVITNFKINNQNIIHTSWRDISDRKELEKALVNSNDKYKSLVYELDHRVKEQSAQLIKQSKMVQMGELLSMIAHQWRQPLGSIAAVVINLKMKFEFFDSNKIERSSFDDLREYTNKKLDELEKYIQSLSNTIDDFKNLYTSGTNMRVYSIVKPIDDAIDLIQASLMAENVKIEKFYHTYGDVNIQNSEIMQVILNIIKNSQDNFKEKNIKSPTITITTTETEKSIKIEIDDNGGGIKENIIEEIFNPYFSTKNEKNGTGLGLYMCKLIIEQSHKGKISAQNISAGASFIIELPKS